MIIIPSTTILSVLETQLRTYIAEYNDQNNAYLYGYASLLIGYNFAANPKTFNINGTDYLIDINTTSPQNIVTTLNSLLSDSDKSKYQFYTFTFHERTVINLRTIIKTLATLTVSGTLFEVIGFDSLAASGTESKESTILYQIFGQNSFGNFNYLNECAKLLTDTYSNVSDNKSNKLSFSLDYNRVEAGRLPCAIITLANESANNDTINLKVDRIASVNGVLTRTKRFQCNYKVNIMSRNKSECEMLYILFKSVIDSNIEIFDGMGLQNLILSGGDTLLEIEAMDRFFMTISIAFDYSNDNPIYIDRRGLSERLVLYPDPYV